jgi:hypothetical protein
MKHFLAQNLTLPGGNSVQGQLNVPGGGSNPTIGSIISAALPLVIGLAGLGLLLMIISAGYTLMTSAGDAKKMDEGKQRLTFAIVGFIIVFGAYWGVQLIGVMFGTGITPGF